MLKYYLIYKNYIYDKIVNKILNFIKYKRKLNKL